MVLAACESDSMATINQALGYEHRNKLVLVFIDVSASMRADFAVQRELEEDQSGTPGRGQNCPCADYGQNLYPVPAGP